MKKIKFSIIILSLFSLMLFFGCDELDKPIPLNVPIPYTIVTEGSNTIITNFEDFCLKDYQAYQDIVDKLEDITYVTAAYWTDSVSSANLMGDINLVLKTQGGLVLFNKTIPNVNPSAYKSPTPYAIVLSQAEVIAINDYLRLITSAVGSDCFRGELTLSNISGDQPPYYLKGRVEIVFKANVKPSN